MCQEKDENGNLICSWCEESILPEHLIVTDADGEEMHLDCSVERDDGDMINNEVDW